MINLEKPCEGIHYVLHRMPNVSNDQAWEVELKEGVYKGTVLVYGNVQYDGINNKLMFKLGIRETPIENLSNKDPELEDYAGIILEDLIKNNLANGTLVYGKNENN
jgi:hypothetical protein